MKPILSILAATSILTFTTFAGQDIAVTDLPKEVSTAIEKTYPGAKLIKAEKETKRDGLRYEVKIEHNNQHRELDLKPDGTIVKDKLDD